jgi:Ca2+-binding EF-hand superfamily protein
MPWEQRLPDWLDRLSQAEQLAIRRAVAARAAEAREEEARTGRKSRGMLPFERVGADFDLDGAQVRELRMHLEPRVYMREVTERLQLALAAVLDSDNGLRMLGRLHAQLEATLPVFEICRKEEDGEEEDLKLYFTLKDTVSKARETWDGLKELRPSTPPHRLRITVEGARDLINADAARGYAKNGGAADKSDPFVIVRRVTSQSQDRGQFNFGEELHRTAVVVDSLAPRWDESFEISVKSTRMGVVESKEGVSFEVWDCDDTEETRGAGLDSAAASPHADGSGKGKTRDFLGWAFYRPCFPGHVEVGQTRRVEVPLASYAHFQSQSPQDSDDAHGFLAVRLDVLGPEDPDAGKRDVPTLETFGVQVKLRGLEPIERDITRICQSPAQLDEMWGALDSNASGQVSFRELSVYVTKRWPALSSRTAMKRAYRKTLTHDGDGDEWVERHELRALLRNLFFFSKAWTLFNKIEDADDETTGVAEDDGRLDLTEFSRGLDMIGVRLTAERAREEFARCDVDGGGLITFDEFSTWLAERTVPTPVDQAAVELEKQKQAVRAEIEAAIADKAVKVVRSAGLSAEDLVDLAYQRSQARGRFSEQAIEEWEHLYPRARDLPPPRCDPGDHPDALAHVASHVASHDDGHRSSKAEAYYASRDYRDPALNPHYVEPARPPTTYRNAAHAQSALLKRRSDRALERRRRIATRNGGRGERPGDRGLGGALLGKRGPTAVVTVHGARGTRLRRPPVQAFTMQGADPLLGGRTLARERKARREKQRAFEKRLGEIGRAGKKGEGWVESKRRREAAEAARKQRQLELDASMARKQRLAEERREEETERRLREKRQKLKGRLQRGNLKRRKPARIAGSGSRGTSTPNPIPNPTPTGPGATGETKTDDGGADFSASAIAAELGIRGGDAEGRAVAAAAAKAGGDEAALRARLREIKRQKAAIVRRKKGLSRRERSR